MQEADLYKIFTDKLNLFQIEYAVTGSVASIIYGEPRMTHDVDIIIQMESNDIDKLTDAFPVEEFYIPPSEIIKIEAYKRSRGHLNIIHHQTGFKGDFILRVPTHFSYGVSVMLKSSAIKIQLFQQPLLSMW
jgi:hypothetical protein